MQAHSLPDPVARAQRSPAHLELVLRYGLMFGDVLATAGVPRGAAVWLGPDAWDVTPERASAAGLNRLPSAIGDEAADRFLAALAVLDPYHRRDVPAAH